MPGPKTIRRFIRHSASFPLDVCKTEMPLCGRKQLRDMSTGGLSFSSAAEFPIGTIMLIRIPCGDPPFEAEAKVVWCRGRANHFEVGIKMLNPEDAFRARMVEQICRIKEYQEYVQRHEGRNLTQQEAAWEWISKYAKDFPAPADS